MGQPTAAYMCMHVGVNTTSLHYTYIFEFVQSFSHHRMFAHSILHVFVYFSDLDSFDRFVVSSLLSVWCLCTTLSISFFLLLLLLCVLLVFVFKFRFTWSPSHLLRSYLTSKVYYFFCRSLTSYSAFIPLPKISFVTFTLWSSSSLKSTSLFVVVAVAVCCLFFFSSSVHLKR